MNAPHTEVLAAWFARHRGQPVDIVLAGRVFGGRHGESSQWPRDYTYQGGTLCIRFETTELLIVVEPSDFALGAYGQLIVPRAEKATFGWHSYGRPQTQENWCEEAYHLLGDLVLLQRIGVFLTEERFPLAGHSFVELH